MISVCGLLLLAAAVDLQEAEPVGNAFLMECAHDIHTVRNVGNRDFWPV